MYSFTHISIDIDTNNYYARDAKGNVNGYSSSAIDLNKKNVEKQSFGAADLILKVSKVGKRKLAETFLEFSSFKTLMIVQYQASLQNIGSCKKVVANRLKEIFVNLDMHSTGIYSVSTVGVKKPSFSF